MHGMFLRQVFLNFPPGWPGIETMLSLSYEWLNLTLKFLVVLELRPLHLLYRRSALEPHSNFVYTKFYFRSKICPIYMRLCDVNKAFWRRIQDDDWDKAAVCMSSMNQGLCCDAGDTLD
jgi:hypothetical protein